MRKTRNLLPREECFKADQFMGMVLCEIIFEPLSLTTSAGSKAALNALRNRWQMLVGEGQHLLQFVTMMCVLCVVHMCVRVHVCAHLLVCTC